jgi:hypothetical protein
MARIVDPPRFDLLDRVIQRYELLDVQTLISQSSVQEVLCPFSVDFPGCVKSSFTRRC